MQNKHSRRFKNDTKKNSAGDSKMIQNKLSGRFKNDAK